VLIFQLCSSYLLGGDEALSVPQMASRAAPPGAQHAKRAAIVAVAARVSGRAGRRVGGPLGASRSAHPRRVHARLGSVAAPVSSTRPLEAACAGLGVLAGCWSL
jgi:hypothetical protein